MKNFLSFIFFIFCFIQPALADCLTVVSVGSTEISETSISQNFQLCSPKSDHSIFITPLNDFFVNQNDSTTTIPINSAFLVQNVEKIPLSKDKSIPLQISEKSKTIHFQILLENVKNLPAGHYSSNFAIHRQSKDCSPSSQIFTAHLNIPPKISLSSKSENISVKIGKNGEIEPFSSEYYLKTNSKDNFYDFFLSAIVNYDKGTTSAYFTRDNEDYIILTNSDNLPSLSAIENIKNNKSEKSENVIAYRILPNFKKENFIRNNQLQYKILIGENEENDIIQTFKENPLQGTYSEDEDSNGTYEVKINFEVFEK